MAVRLAATLMDVVTVRAVELSRPRISGSGPTIMPTPMRVIAPDTPATPVTRPKRIRFTTGAISTIKPPTVETQAPRLAMISPSMPTELRLLRGMIIDAASEDSEQGRFSGNRPGSSNAALADRRVTVALRRAWAETSAMGSTAAITTWFYAAAADGTLYAVKYGTGSRFLKGSEPRPRVLPDWRDINGGLTLIAVGFVLQMGKPAYLDRWAVSHHWLPTLRTPADECREPHVDLEVLAGRLLADAAPGIDRVTEFAGFLQLSQRAVVVEDLYGWMQEGRASLDQFWARFLVEGRQSYSLWNIRTGAVHPPHTPLVLRDSRARTISRRPTRPTL
jgi:hypothetical protein